MCNFEICGVDKLETFIIRFNLILSISLYTIFSKSSIVLSAPMSTERSGVDIGADAAAQV